MLCLAYYLQFKRQQQPDDQTPTPPVPGHSTVHMPHSLRGPAPAALVAIDVAAVVVLGAKAAHPVAQLEGLCRATAEVASLATFESAVAARRAIPLTGPQRAVEDMGSLAAAAGGALPDILTT